MYNSFNIPKSTKIYSNSFNSNISSKVSAYSAFLSAVKTEADASLVLTSYII